MAASHESPNDPARAVGGKRTFLACLGDANDPQTWSGTPYHVLMEGKRQGIIDEGLVMRTDLPAVKRSRLLWNAWQMLRGFQGGGYQSSAIFQERLWKPHAARLRGGRVVSHFQMLAPSIVAAEDIERWYYIDGTYRQLMDDYGLKLDSRFEREVIAREQENYRRAAGVMTMSRYAAASVERDYGVAAGRVHVVVPGANLSADLYDAFEPQLIAIHQSKQQADRQDADRPLRIVFVGRDAERKGALRLLGATAIGRQRGLRMVVRLIGLSESDVPEAYRGIAGVEWMGVISRRTQSEKFCQALAECDVGCLLSRAEFAGISIRESLAFGLPVVGPETGGSPDLMSADTCWSVLPTQSDEEVAQLMLRIEQNRAEFASKRSAAWQTRRDMLWAPAISKVREHLEDAARQRQPK